MVFCMAIAWPRMNEAGAFWALMVGLLIGVIRMISDFSYRAPLCMEEDSRPAIVAKVNFKSKIYLRISEFSKNE